MGYGIFAPLALSCTPTFRGISHQGIQSQHLSEAYVTIGPNYESCPERQRRENIVAHSVAPKAQTMGKIM
jgi:hypothetical protein